MTRQNTANDIVFKYPDDPDKIRYRNTFRSLVQTGENDQVKSIVIWTDIPNVADHRGQTLLHLAAKYNNCNLMPFLLALGCPIDALTKCGNTALHMALLKDKYEAASFLLSRMNNTLFFPHAVTNIVRVLLTRKHREEIIDFMRSLNNYCGPSNLLARALVEVSDNPMKHALRVRDARLTQELFNTTNFTMTEKQVAASLKYTMKTEDIGSLRVFWRQNNKIRERIIQMIYGRIYLRSPSRWSEYVTTIFKQISTWACILEPNLTRFLENLLMNLRVSAVEYLLIECKIDEQIKETFDLDILPFVFGNPKKKRVLTNLVQTRPYFYVNSRSIRGMTALHYAAMQGALYNIKLLLELGADCNAKDQRGHTPIKYVARNDCAECLLRNGADLQILDTKGKSILEDMETLSCKWKVLYAHLAVEKCRGVAIRQGILDQMNTERKYKKFYENCCNKLMYFHPLVRFPTITLFYLLTTNPMNIPHCMRRRNDVSTVISRCRKPSVLYYYRTSLQLILEKVYNVFRSKCRFVAIISKSTSTTIHYNHIITEEIFSFLSYQDILTITSV